MAIPPLLNSTRFPIEDCKDPAKLSKLLQGMSQGSVRVAQSQRAATQRVATSVASVETKVAEVAAKPTFGVLRTIDAVDLTSAAGTILFTAGTDTYEALGFKVRFTAVDTVSVAPTVGVGTTSSTTDIFAPRTLSGTLAVNGGPIFFPSGYRPTLTTGTTAYFVVTGAATATSLVASIDLIGYKA